MTGLFGRKVQRMNVPPPLPPPRPPTHKPPHRNGFPSNFKISCQSDVPRACLNLALSLKSNKVPANSNYSSCSSYCPVPRSVALEAHEKRHNVNKTTTNITQSPRIIHFRICHLTNWKRWRSCPGLTFGSVAFCSSSPASMSLQDLERNQAIIQDKARVPV